MFIMNIRNIMKLASRIRLLELHSKRAGVGHPVETTQLGGVHRMPFTGYNQAGTERTPRGRSSVSRHSALSPKAREGDPTARGRLEIFQKSLMAEDGRIELRRVSPRLTAYKAVSAPNGLRLPYQESRCASKAAAL